MIFGVVDCNNRFRGFVRGVDRRVAFRKLKRLDSSLKLYGVGFVYSQGRKRFYGRVRLENEF